MTAGFKTKNQLVYEHLREGILTGRLRPGQRIVVGEVAAAVGVSDIPVRESLRKLESEGLVSVVPHVGARVTEIDLQGLTDLYLMRAVTEALAARLATEVLSGADLARLRELNAVMREAGLRGDPETAGRVNWDFHTTICGAIDRPRLVRAVSELRDQTRRFRALFVLVPDRIAVSVAEHEAIIGAFEARDGVRVEALVRRHCEGALELLRRHYTAEGERDRSAAPSHGRGPA